MEMYATHQTVSVNWFQCFVCLLKPSVGCRVQFSLLSVEEQAACWPASAGPFISPVTSVQLQTRHWIIRDQNGEVTEDVAGDGVIGRYPILVPGTPACAKKAILSILSAQHLLQHSLSSILTT